MRYLGWILALLFAAAGVAAYFVFYQPLERGYAEQREEIGMWTDKVSALEQGLPVDTTPVPEETTEIDTTLPADESTHGTLIATISVDDLFSSSKLSRLSESGKVELDKLLPAIKTSEKDVVIMVHSDNVRADESLRDIYPTNWELTARRAASIARYLLSRNVHYRRLVPCGMSAARPLASNSTAPGRAKNRRVEIYLK